MFIYLRTQYLLYLVLVFLIPEIKSQSESESKSQVLSESDKQLQIQPEPSCILSNEKRNLEDTIPSNNFCCAGDVCWNGYGTLSIELDNYTRMKDSVYAILGLQCFWVILVVFYLVHIAIHWVGKQCLNKQHHNSNQIPNLQNQQPNYNNQYQGVLKTNNM